MKKTKTLTFKYEDMLHAAQLLNQITVSGTSNFRALSAIADILDSGTVGEISEREDKKDGMDKQTILKDKLAEPAVNGDSSGSDKPKQD